MEINNDSLPQKISLIVFYLNGKKKDSELGTKKHNKERVKGVVHSERKPGFVL